MNRLIRNSLLAIAVTGLAGIAESADEQIVIEDLSPAQLRTEIEKVQTEFFRVFNVSNTDDDLDIICHEYIPTMSHIKEKACEPQFLIEARAKNVEDYQRGTDDLLTPQQLRSDQQQGFQRLTAAMNEVMKTNDYFRELNGVLNMLQARLKELTE